MGGWPGRERAVPDTELSPNSPAGSLTEHVPAPGWKTPAPHILMEKPQEDPGRPSQQLLPQERARTTGTTDPDGGASASLWEMLVPAEPGRGQSRGTRRKDRKGLEAVMKPHKWGEEG